MAKRDSTLEPPAWTEQNLNDPHHTADKARRVEAMFAAIAESYDLNNRLHSLWRDQAWRRTAVRMAGVHPGERVLDVACGTGDLSIEFAQALADGCSNNKVEGRVTGVDFTFEMLSIAGGKTESVGRHPVEYLQADALALPVADESVDVLSIAFGIRNVTDPDAALAEFYRVLRPGGRLIVLEFSEPTNPLLRWFNNLYTAHIMPVTASWIARDRSGAYRYLPRSVSTFLRRSQMLEKLGRARFSDLWHKPLTFGIAVCYRGVKPQ